MSQAFNFIAGTQNHSFLMSDNGFDYLQGPIGTGKTKTCCVRLMRHAQQQMKSPKDGLRYSRFFVCRNSMPILKLSTIRTWLETFPEATFGKFNFGTPMGHKIEYGDVRTQFDFISLDNEDDIKRMRSTEYTGGFFNEASYTEKSLVDEAQSRLRYPPREHSGPTWSGIILDGNAPDEDCWLATMSGQVDPPAGASPQELEEKFTWPPTWGLYMQPPALIAKYDEKGTIFGYEVNRGQDPRFPASENLENLPDGYYERMLPAKSRAWIDAHLMNKVAFVTDGAPVWPMFRKEFHVAAEALKPVVGHTVTVGLDFGRVYPAALFAQEIAGRIYVQHEILGWNEGATAFAPRVKKHLTQNYAGCPVRFIGDPKGRDRGQTSDQSSYDIWASLGMPVQAAPVKMNDIETRLEAVAHLLNDNPSGVPRLVISPTCRTLIVGMAGRYCLERAEKGELKPRKDKYSNLPDALQYLALGLGEGRKMIGLDAAYNLKPAKIANRRSLRRISE